MATTRSATARSATARSATARAATAPLPAAADPVIVTVSPRSGPGETVVIMAAGSRGPAPAMIDVCLVSPEQYQTYIDHEKPCRGRGPGRAEPGAGGRGPRAEGRGPGAGGCGYRREMTASSAWFTGG